jgi:SsrA-binding protein
MKLIAQNKKASHDYFILDTYEVGIVLQGTEIKSIRQGKVSIKDAYARVSGGELFLINMHVSKYKQGNIFNHDETRERKLLMGKRDITRLATKIKAEGLTLIPTKIYLREGLCKLELALCKGKKLYDKRETKKREDMQRRVDKTLKDYQQR